MKDRQSRFKHRQRHVPICGAIFLILIAGSIAAAQLRPLKEGGGSQKSSQAESARANAQSESQVIVNTDLVSLMVSVTDSHGRYVRGLDKKDFTIIDNKVPQQIAFFSDADVPVSVGIVFDVSGSMSGKKIERAKEALSNFIQTSHPDDEYSLIGFTSQPQLLLDRSRDGDAVIKKLSFVEPHGSTALYDATYLALECVARGTHQKRAILIISDGQDNNSRYTFGQLGRAVKESDVIIYAIGIEGGAGGMLAMYGSLLLEELVSISGGKVFFPRKSTQMNEALEQIALELRHQYSIGYRPSNLRIDGKWHRIKVNVIPPQELKRVFVRSREGYYAAGSLRRHQH